MSESMKIQTSESVHWTHQEISTSNYSIGLMCIVRHTSPEEPDFYIKKKCTLSLYLLVRHQHLSILLAILVGFLWPTSISEHFSHAISSFMRHNIYEAKACWYVKYVYCFLWAYVFVLVQKHYHLSSPTLFCVCSLFLVMAKLLHQVTSSKVTDSVASSVSNQSSICTSYNTPWTAASLLGNKICLTLYSFNHIKVK